MKLHNSDSIAALSRISGNALPSEQKHQNDTFLCLQAYYLIACKLVSLCADDPIPVVNTAHPAKAPSQSPNHTGHLRSASSYHFSELSALSPPSP